MDTLQKMKWPPKSILVDVQATRKKKGENGPSKATIYRFLNGTTFKRNQQETRGRTARLPHGLVRIANGERLKLIKEAGNDWTVTWQDVHKATKRSLQRAGLLDKAHRMPSEDWLRRLVRGALNIRARPGKRRISHKARRC